MVRTLTVVIGMAMLLLAARDASAIPITLTPVDLDSWVGGTIVRSRSDLFKTQSDPPITTGEISSQVFFDGVDEYTYAHRVMSYVNVYSAGVTSFQITGNPTGFTGIAGWSFSDALRAGGTGTGSDFDILWSEDVGYRSLQWSHLFDWWDPFEPIQFFFVSSTRRSCPSFNPHCSVGGWLYDLSSRDFDGMSRAPGLAPIPEPGSIALFGSGLVGLFAAMRRRQRAKG
jgi:hypothetical protein